MSPENEPERMPEPTPGETTPAGAAEAPAAAAPGAVAGSAPAPAAAPGPRRAALAPQTQELGDLLLRGGLTIAIAESLTGGALTAELASIPGISASLQAGIVAYQTPLKHSLLGVSKDLLAERGAVDPDVAVAMAKGVRRAVKDGRRGPEADIGVSTTGVAGPAMQDGKPAGTVYIGLSSLFGERAVSLDFSLLVDPDDPLGSRQRIRRATVEAAVFNVVELLASR